MKNEGLEIAGLDNDGLIKVQRLVKVGQDLIQLQPTTDCLLSWSVHDGCIQPQYKTVHMSSLLRRHDRKLLWKISYALLNMLQVFILYKMSSYRRETALPGAL